MRHRSQKKKQSEQTHRNTPQIFSHRGMPRSVASGRVPAVVYSPKGESHRREAPRRAPGGADRQASALPATHLRLEEEPLVTSSDARKAINLQNCAACCFSASAQTPSCSQVTPGDSGRPGPLGTVSVRTHALKRK